MKTTLLAALAALALVGCGPSQPSEARSNQLVVDRTERDTDRWARSAYAVYGEAAVETCLAAFHASQRTASADPVEPGSHGAPASYREQLADFMCACARGQSAEECPVP
jgi:hypothetical protein